ncbi:hypothetical protein DRP53_04395 [candidate division WOR-3 bacterium]|uniref:T9SS type A sorting domain-containing protein n=1 Tax=candidate division WOR-3 bacterium TaxID=2052148 RepID=A0A660SL14_UNCW3|nr:MAG: hypothetical protein DRP53_04395 [candidate division WOR-3 bacterium]
MAPLLSVLLVLASASHYVPFDQVKTIAQKWAEKEWPDLSLARVLTYYNLEGEVNGYAFIFSKNPMPSDQILVDEILKERGRRPRNRYGVDEYATIIMSARFGEVPIFQYYRGLPGIYSIRRYLPPEYDNAQPLRVYYYGPGDEWIEFATTEGTVLIHGYSGWVYQKEEVRKRIGGKSSGSEYCFKFWRELINNDFVTRDSNKIPDMVPFYEWHYGCSPTASAMLLGYWDARNYAKLVDFFFGPRYSYPENEWDDGIPNCQRELALAMYTDTMTGGTSIYYIHTGQRAVCNGYNNNYNFQSNMYGPGTQSNPYVTWNIIKQEIDAGRPLHWAVLGWGPGYNHSLAGVGYKTVGSERYVYVNTTWYENEEWWVQHTSGSRDYCYPLIPGGGINCDLRLTYPDTKAMMFRGLKYKIKWNATGSQGIDHLSIFRHTGYNQNTWVTLATNVPNNGAWVWTAPTDSLTARFAIKGYSSSNSFLAADGESIAFDVRTYQHSNELLIVGHYDTDGSAADVVWSNNYLYCADNQAGLAILDVSDSSLPDLKSTLPLPSAVAIAYKSPNLYVADESDTLFVIDVSDPTNPTRKGSWAAPDVVLDVVRYKDKYVVCACKADGIFVLDISSANPQQVGSYDTPGQAYALFVRDTLLYVADGTRGLRIISLADPANPKEIGSCDPTGIAKGIGVVGDYAYLCNGGLGISVIDVSDPQNPSVINTIDTPGTATWARGVSMTHLFVGDDESGIRIYDISNPNNPSEVGYLDSHGSATRMAFNGDLIYLADGGDGIYVVHCDLIGVEEEKTTKEFRLVIPSLTSNRLTISGFTPVPKLLRIEVSDVLGRRLTEFKVNINGEFSLSSPIQLTSGVYFVTVRDEEDVFHSKVVVIK